MLERIKERVEDTVDKGRATARVYVPKKEALGKGFKDYLSFDMRWSYGLIAVAIVVGIVASFMSHGWTVWPFVFIVCFMSMVHEAAQRNGQGVPPFHVYALLVGTIVGWIVVVAIFSLVNPVILLFGLIA